MTRAEIKEAETKLLQMYSLVPSEDMERRMRIARDLSDLADLEFNLYIEPGMKALGHSSKDIFNAILRFIDEGMGKLDARKPDRETIHEVN